jgi:hypothetical protein
VDQDSLEQYHVPGTYTLTFAMAEIFVARFGFKGDKDSASHLQVFEALSLLHQVMIIRRDFDILHTILSGIMSIPPILLCMVWDNGPQGG